MTAATLGWSARLVMLAAATVLAVCTIPTALRTPSTAAPVASMRVLWGRMVA